MDDRKVISNELLDNNVDIEFVEFQIKRKIKNLEDLKNTLLDDHSIDPNANFSSESYLKSNSDVASYGMNPFFHFLRYGKNEGRGISISKKENCDKFDISRMPNVLEHFKINQDRVGLFFDESFYNEKYEGAWGWNHYLEYGYLENKAPNRDVVPEVLVKFFSEGNSFLPLINMVEYLDYISGHDKVENKKVIGEKISVVILNWNKSLMTIQCVLTLIKNSYSNQLEIIVVDNGSRDEEFRKLLALRGLNQVKIIRNKTNRYYGEANNIGVEASSYDYICLLNNDAFVGVDWDKHLIEELESDEAIGGVGPKFLFPNGKLQEAGGMLNPCGQNVQVGKGLDPNLPFFNRTADVTHISAACFLLKKSTFERVNGFDFRYEPAYFEDADLTAKIATLGLKIRYVPKSEVIHVENATSKEPDIGFNFGSLIGTNRMKFVERWGDFLRGGKAPFVPDFTKEYNKSEVEGSNDKVAVIYSPYNLTPGGGERYVLSLAISARDNGYKTYFCSPEKYSKYRLHTIAHELGLDVHNIALMGEEELHSRLDVSLFIAMSNELSPSIKAKGLEKNIYHCQFPFPMSDWHQTNCIDNVTDYDIVIVNSEFTKQAYQREAKKFFVAIPNVEVISPPVDMIDNIAKPTDGIVRILNVGRFIAGGHCKKQKELVKAFNLLYKQLKIKGIESKFTLVGSLGSGEDDRKYLKEIQDISGNNVDIVLNASRETIIQKYQESDFYWHGTGIGEDIDKSPEVFEHFGITPVEAMSAGCIPIVWHEGGPREVIKSLNIDETKFSASNIFDYVEKTISLLESQFSIETDIFSENEFMNKLHLVINDGKA